MFAALDSTSVLSCMLLCLWSAFLSSLPPAARYCSWGRHHMSDRIMSMSGSVLTCAQCVQTTTWSQAFHPPFNCLMLLIFNGLCRYWFIATHCCMCLRMAEQYQSSLRLTVKSGGADTLFWRTQSCLTSAAFLWLQGQHLYLLHAAKHSIILGDQFWESLWIKKYSVFFKYWMHYSSCLQVWTATLQQLFAICGTLSSLANTK